MRKKLSITFVVVLLTLILAFCGWAAGSKKSKSKVQEQKQPVEISAEAAQKMAFET